MSEVVSFVTGSARRVGKVFHRERADALAPALALALDAYAQSGPWPIVVVDGLRAGTDAAARQASYFASGASKARTLGETPHGRGGAFDFAVVKQAAGDAVVSTYPADENPSLYASVGAWFEARGLTWGGRWSSFGANGDAPHIEVPNWRALPMPRGGNVS